MELLLDRLDNLVLKLEKAGGNASAAANNIRSELASVRKGSFEGLASIIETLEGGGGVSSAADNSASLASYETILAGPFQQFKSACEAIGGDVASIGQLVNHAFDVQRHFLGVAAESKKPSSTDNLQKLLKPTSDAIGEIQQFRERNRKSEMFNHLSAISESIPALGWVAMAPTPAPYVKEMRDAGQFYTNRY